MVSLDDIGRIALPSRDRRAAMIAEINAYVGNAADFVYLAGANADHATVEQYRLAKLFGRTAHPVMLTVGDGVAQPMTPPPRTDRDGIDMLVRSERDIPRGGMPVAAGRDIPSIGVWPEHGIRTPLGPNKNGKRR